MIVIGICGGSGSGKSFICQRFSIFHIPTLNTDKLYHDMISADSECSRALIASFGKIIANEQNGINREILRQIVFAPEADEKRLLLNSIAHRYIRIETLKWIEKQRRSGYKAVTIDAPLLFESKFDEICDCVIAVVAPTDIRLRRICARDKISLVEATNRISVQISNDELIHRSDFYIDNDDKNDIDKQIQLILSKVKIEQ